jgi:nitroreductase
VSSQSNSATVLTAAVPAILSAGAGVHDLIGSRWSPRSFSSREVSDQDLKTILEAARWAASSYNEQPWRFFVARRSDDAAYEKILGFLAPANQTWAKSAPVLMITATKRTFSHNGSPNYYAMHDAGQALANLSLQATALGLHAHAMGGFDHEKARKRLGLPDDYALGAAIALGYSDVEMAARTRKPLSDIVFSANWNESLAL